MRAVACRLSVLHGGAAEAGAAVAVTAVIAAASTAAAGTSATSHLTRLVMNVIRQQLPKTHNSVKQGLLRSVVLALCRTMSVTSRKLEVQSKAMTGAVWCWIGVWVSAVLQRGIEVQDPGIR